MRESVSGVPPRSYSGSVVPLHDSGKGLWTGHTVSRAWLRRVGPQRHPTLTLSPSRLQRGVSIIHRTTGLVSCPVRRRPLAFQLCQAISLGLISSATFTASSSDRQVLDLWMKALRSVGGLNCT